MSKTAKEWTDEGASLSNAQEAIKCFDQAIAADPKYGRAYFLKGRKQSSNAIATEWYEKAIALGFEEEDVYYYLACSYANYENGNKKLESVAAFDKHFAKYPTHWQSMKFKGFLLTSLDKKQEAIDALQKAYDLNPSGSVVNGNIGLLLEELGRDDEALKQFDIGLGHIKTDFKCNYYKGRLLARHGKNREAIPFLEQAMTASGNNSDSCLSAGKCYQAIGDEKKAKEIFELGLKKTPGLSIEWCNRAQIYLLLGQKEKALDDIKETKKILEDPNDLKNLSPATMKHMKDTIRVILDAEDAAKKGEEATKQAEEAAKAAQAGSTSTNAPKTDVVLRFAAHIKKLTEEKNKAQDKVILQINDHESAQKDKDKAEMERITAELNKKIEEMNKEMAKLAGKVDVVEKKVTVLENNMEAMKEELANKMDDFDKKLDTELKKQDLSPDDIEALKKYFGAFVCTFSCAYATAQVVNSGQVKLDVGTSAGSVLSVLASFAPFIGDTLSSAVSSIDEFLSAKEMKTSSRKLLHLAHETTKLSQVVGKAGYEIVMDKKKQQSIIKTTGDDLGETSKNLYKKVLAFCEKLSQQVDAYLYSDMYSSPAERLGHNDANLLIAYWIKEGDVPYDIEKKFVKEIMSALNAQKKEEIRDSTPVQQTKDKACCNMF